MLIKKLIQDKHAIETELALVREQQRKSKSHNGNGLKNTAQNEPNISQAIAASIKKAGESFGGEDESAEETWAQKVRKKYLEGQGDHSLPGNNNVPETEDINTTEATNTSVRNIE